MTKDEFIKNASSLGYCTKEQAKEYCKDKDELTEDDYIRVFRKANVYEPTNNGTDRCNNGRTTKRYKPDGADNR